MDSSGRNTKEFGTLRSRFIHYLMFAYGMNWDDDPLMATMSIRRANLQLALYAAHLGSGETLLHRAIRVGTVKRYIADIAFIFRRIHKVARDVRYANPHDPKLCPELNAVFKELERYEKMPNRRDPFTPEMLHYQMKRAQELGHHGLLSLLSAIADWSEVNLFIGARLTEWAQPDNRHTDPDKPHIQPGYVQARAFCLSDLKFFRAGNKIFRSIDAVLRAPSEVETITLCWRTQKNGQNGETRKFSRNHKPGGHCFVRAMLNIVKRFVALRSSSDLTTPLALYRDTASQKTLLFTPRVIEQTMRDTAAAVYDLDPSIASHKETLSKWSAHSYRVGACCVLHSLGYSETQIKYLLRWRSNAFMDYLRNLKVVSDQHHRDLDRAAAFPQFL